MLHMIEEYARHCGHADLIRESIERRERLTPLGALRSQRSSRQPTVSIDSSLVCPPAGNAAATDSATPGEHMQSNGGTAAGQPASPGSGRNACDERLVRSVNFGQPNGLVQSIGCPRRQ